MALAPLIASLNPVFQAAAERTELGWLLGATTLFFLLAFVAWTVWVMSPTNRDRMEAWGRLPLEDDLELGGGDR